MAEKNWLTELICLFLIVDYSSWEHTCAPSKLPKCRYLCVALHSCALEVTKVSLFISSMRTAPSKLPKSQVNRLDILFRFVYYEMQFLGTYQKFNVFQTLSVFGNNSRKKLAH